MVFSISFSIPIAFLFHLHIKEVKVHIWKFETKSKGFICKSETFGHKMKYNKMTRTNVPKSKYSLGLDCTIKSIKTNSLCKIEQIRSLR